MALSDIYQVGKLLYSKKNVLGSSYSEAHIHERASAGLGSALYVTFILAHIANVRVS